MESQNPSMTCAICLDHFKDPCTIPCGHNFCHSCIKSHWDSATNYYCPICKEEYHNKPALRRNVDLCELIEGPGSLGVSGVEGRAAGGEGSRDVELCHRHGKPLVLFCNQEKMSVCYECAVKQCDSHDKSMLEEERQNQERLIKETERRIHDLSENINQANVTLQQTCEWVSAKFQSLLKSLLEKKLEEQRDGTITEAQRRLSELEERAQKLKENKEQVSTLRELPDTELIKKSMLVTVPEYQDICTEVSPNLQERVSGVTDVLSRVSKLLHEDLERAVGTALGHDKQASPQDKRPVLAVVPSPAAPFAPGLREELDSQRCSLTFDPRTANSHLSLSHGNTRAEHLTSGPRAVPEDDVRFDHTWQVLCCQGFSQGVHYWELTVSKPWAFVGVTYESIPRKEKGKRCMVGMNDVSWSLQLDERQLSACHGGRQEPVSGPPPPHCRIGVHLDYDGGTLTFYGPDQSRLHAFHCTPFTHPLYPACWIGEGVSVSLCPPRT
uniref:Uncharacterized protein n=1 Tax=Periophthalmus magnuspinnatus TaxID=409849 RepID=A0A3B4BAK4_9GOBI